MGTFPDIKAVKQDLISAKQVLLAANQFRVIPLKVYMESLITDKLLDTENDAELLCSVDGHACPLLKEACMQLYRDNPDEVQEASTTEWKKVEESTDLLKEIIQFMTRKRRRPKHFEDYENLAISTLREKLESSNLDLDGKRSMLVKRLKNGH